MEIISVSDMYLYSAKRRTTRVNMVEEEGEQDKGRFLSFTPNGLNLPSQKGRSSLYPASLSIQNPVHQNHVTPAGSTMHFP